MRTTVDIHDPLLERAKALANRTNRRLGDIVNDALVEMLSRQEEAEQSPRTRVTLPSFRGSGVAPGIDPTSNASYLDAMDEEARDPQTGRSDIRKLRKLMDLPDVNISSALIVKSSRNTRRSGPGSKD